MKHLNVSSFFPGLTRPLVFPAEIKNLFSNKNSSRHSPQEIIPPNTAFNKQFLDLLKKIFVYDPKQRITAKNALKHAWFKESLVDDGTEAARIRREREKDREREREREREGAGGVPYQ